jgi:proline dehydrogenase
METSPTANLLTRRFIAGQTLDDVLAVCRKLDAQRFLASVDHLGENVGNPEEAESACRYYERTQEAIHASGLPATISVKLTQLGLDLSEDLCRRHLRRLMERARAQASRVEVDMESSEYTDRTLALVTRMHEEYACVRSVIQAYLYRSLADVRELNRRGIPVRLCKGAYNEPSSEAFPEKREVDGNYLKLARLLLEEGTEPALATHDPRMIDGSLDHAHTKAAGRAFEFQMLYGVRRDLQTRLVDGGYRLRLYVPYGDAWFPYFMRRLAERPANVFFIARNLVRA